jgi:RNA polymerase sigma-70 factor (ECF subfamily)
VEKSFEQLITQHQEEIYRYIIKLTRSDGESEDLFQETFLRAYKAYNRLPEGSNSRAWLFKIATNLCKNYFRTRQRHHTIALDDALDTIETRSSDANGHSQANPEQIMLSKDMERKVLTIIDGLPFKQKAALIQRKFHGQEYDSIAVSLGCSPDAARANVFQALKKIREELEGAPRTPKSARKGLMKTTGEIPCNR